MTHFISVGLYPHLHFVLYFLLSIMTGEAEWRGGFKTEKKEKTLSLRLTHSSIVEESAGVKTMCSSRFHRNSRVNASEKYFSFSNDDLMRKRLNLIINEYYITFEVKKEGVMFILEVVQLIMICITIYSFVKTENRLLTKKRQHELP